MAATNPSAAGDAAELVALDDVSYSVGDKSILESITTRIRRGELLSILGPNGGGKTSLLRLVLGIRQPTGGSIKRLPMRIGYQPQQTNLNPAMPLSVAALLALGARDPSRAALSARLEMLGLDPKLLDAQVGQLSGGQRQLVSIARAMLREPDLLVLDEPGSYCDPRSMSKLYRAIEEFSDQQGCATICVSHDITRVLKHSDHILCIERRVICEGGPADIVRDTEFEEVFGEQAHTGLFTHRHHYHE